MTNWDLTGETKRGITSTENRLASFRYEHTDFETGFVVRVIPIDSGSFSFYVSIDEDLSQTTVQFIHFVLFLVSNSNFCFVFSFFTHSHLDRSLGLSIHFLSAPRTLSLDHHRQQLLTISLWFLKSVILHSIFLLILSLHSSHQKVKKIDFFNFFRENNLDFIHETPLIDLG